jgi:hypothetical protein
VSAGGPARRGHARVSRPLRRPAPVATHRRQVLPPARGLATGIVPSRGFEDDGQTHLDSTGAGLTSR